MFLSDRLIGIGKRSNPKNNLSMNEHKDLMLKECQDAIRERETTILQAKTAFAFACVHLNKSGYPYFRPEHFNQV